MPTENHIIVDRGVTLHPETNTGQIYDFKNSKWLSQTIEDLQEKPVTWGEVNGKPTSFPPSPHTHTVSQITDFPDPYNLPAASINELGGIKPDGTTITVDPYTGIASANVQTVSEWVVLNTEIGWGVRTPPLRVRREGDMFRIYGSLQKTSQDSNLAFVLPEGMRPSNNIQSVAFVGGSLGYVNLLPNGNVFITETNDNLVFVNITFF